jgi:nitrate reductase gamma subunit
MTALVFVPYLAALVFIAAVVIRWVKIARLPVHLRWELYPVAHERNSAYGGSFFERLDWWKHHPPTNRMGELKVMVPEMLLLTGVHEHDRALWFRSYPFHLGLYLLAGFIGLLVVGAAAQTFGVRVEAGWLTTTSTVVGVAGLVLLAAGSLGLLLRRLASPALRAHSAAADFANLIFFFTAAVLGLVTFATVDGDFANLRLFVRALVTFQPAGEMPALVAVEIVVASALAAYIPLTHMSHFFTKWFMYHDVRWNDEVNRVGSKLEAAIGRQLGHKVSWSAPHIRGDGKKTWVDVATERVSDSGLRPVELDAGDGKNPPRVLSQKEIGKP